MVYVNYISSLKEKKAYQAILMCTQEQKLKTFLTKTLSRIQG